jgi:uncharacterized RDD family membrane protein YckC
MTPDPDMQPDFYDGVPTKRLLAWVVDMFVVAGMTLLVVPLTAFIGLFFLPFLFVTISFCYRVVSLARGSATWGMRLMSIELRDREDAPFELPTAFMHTLGYALSWAMPLLQIASVVAMLSSQRRQGLSDMALGSVALNRRS